MTVKKYQRILLAATICCVIAGLVIHVSPYRWTQETQIDGNYRDTRTVESFDRLEISTNVYDVKIKEGSEYTCSYQCGSEKEIPQISSGDGVLHVTRNGGGVHVFGLRRDGGELTITVPHGKELSVLKLQQQAGNATLTGISCRRLQLDLSAGDVLLRDVQAAEATADMSAGSFRAKSSALDSASLDLSAGNTYLDKTAVENCSIDCAAGDVYLKLPGTEDDYALELDASFGELSVNGKKRGTTYETSPAHSRYSVRADLSAGDLEADFAE